MRIKGMRSETPKMVAEREVGGKFVSLADFLSRVPVEDDEMTNLILAGRFRYSRAGCVAKRPAVSLPILGWCR